VLVEKPIGMSAAEAKRLVAARERSGKLIVEAFMARYAPQWVRTRAIIASGRIGTVHCRAGARHLPQHGPAEHPQPT
jgi:predicted dehydrogenase